MPITFSHACSIVNRGIHIPLNAHNRKILISSALPGFLRNIGFVLHLFLKKIKWSKKLFILSQFCGLCNVYYDIIIHLEKETNYAWKKSFK